MCDYQNIMSISVNALTCCEYRLFCNIQRLFLRDMDLAFLDNVMLSDNSLLNGSDPHLQRPFSVGKAVKHGWTKGLAYKFFSTYIICSFR
jgi:hypothetical protein